MDLIGISIILPTYNRVDTLKECIYSILNQNFYKWELNIVDDSTTIEVERFIQELRKNDLRIRYHKNEIRKGLPGSRNVGISISTYDLIIFIEDDLILQPNALELLVNDYITLKQSGKNVGAIAPSRPWVSNNVSRLNIINYSLINKNIHLNEIISRKDDLVNSLNTPCVRDKFTGIIYSNFSPTFKELQEVPDVHSCSLYSKRLLNEVGGYDEKRFRGNFLYEETDLNYRIWRRGYKFYFDPKAIMYHKITTEGGCRVNKLRYDYFFVLNHIKYVSKNFGLKSIYMVPFFLIFVAIRCLKQIIALKRGFCQ